jgi:hypothetical protein
MKSILLLLALTVITATPALAESNTSNATYATPSPAFTEFLNNQDVILHSHQVDKEDKHVQAVAELDVVVYETGIVEIAAMGKHNLETSITEAGVKVKLNAFKFFKK